MVWEGFTSVETRKQVRIYEKVEGDEKKGNLKLFSSSKNAKLLETLPDIIDTGG